MKILGFNIKRSPKVEIIQDVVPEVKTSIPKAKKPALMPFVKDPTLRYNAVKTAGRGHFQSPEYDLAEVGRVSDTESYVSQAFNKKTALMFKEGWDITGPDPRTIKYIKARLAQIARASRIPTLMLFRQIGTGLIKTSNAFLIKIRKTEASGGRLRKDPGKTTFIKPTAAYFIAPPETMEYQLSGNKIVQWQQRMPNGDRKSYNPRDVIHFFYDRKEGFVFGTPTVTPVLDDIRALRKIEENIELLVYQHLFPLFQYIVGTENQPATIDEDGNHEVDVIKREIQYMPTEGGIVTPERHEIKAIGAEGRAIRAEGYLEHFKKRVFSGLGVSSVDMGEGHTSNRACYSEDTETLTDSGFKKYWEITNGDKIATFNPETNQVEFQHSDGSAYLYDYEGEMIHFKNRNVDVLVTPDHDMWVGQPTWSRGLDWQKIHAEDISQFQVKFRTGGLQWEGEEPGDFLLPHVSYKCRSSVPNAGPFPRIKIRDWLEFLGYYISEGCLAKGKGKWAVTISQNSVRNKRKAQKIRECLQRLPFKFNEYTSSSDRTTRFWIHCKSLYLYLQETCGDYSYLKHLPDEVLDYDVKSLRIVFEALMLGDGTTSHQHEGSTSRTYYSTSDQLIDQVQEIALKLGYRAHVLPGSKCKRVCMSDGEVSNITKNWISTQQYSGKVYCFNVPNHLFITRRNGRIGIHGNTADNMSRNLIDSVKDLQQVAEIFINEFIIGELLLESTFGPTVLDNDRRCYLKFKEIDIDAQIKKEAHHADQFAKDIVTWDEARTKIGYEPILVPTREEIDSEQDTAKKYPEWHKTRWKLFEEPKLIIQSLDEAWTPIAKAVSKSASLELSEGDIVKAGEETKQKEKELEQEKAKGKIAVEKAKPKQFARSSKPKVKNGYLANTFIEVKKDVVKRVSKEEKIDHDWVGALIRVQMTPTIDRLVAEQVISFRKGYSVHARPEGEEFTQRMTVVRTLLRNRAEEYIVKLTESVIGSLRRNVDNNGEPVEIKTKTRAVFDALQYRTKFIEDVEVRKAWSFGLLTGARTQEDADAELKVYSIASQDEPCENCQARSGQLMSVPFVTLDDVPPYHAKCSCTFNVEFVDAGTATQDATIEEPEPGDLPKKDYSPCPKCGKTAMRTKNTADQYNCKACGHTFKKIQDEESEEVEDRKRKVKKTKSKLGPKSKQFTFTKCVMKAMGRLRAKHPEWDEGQLEMIAEAACDHLLQVNDDTGGE